MDNQTIIERGNASEQLLNQPEFTRIFKDLMDHYINAMVQSAPHEKDVRDSAYYQSRALQDIVGVINQWIVMRDQVLDNTEDKE